MVKQGSILMLALALLLSLPSCWKKEKKAVEPKKSKNMDQMVQADKPGEEFDIADDQTIKSFFEDMEEFTEFDLADASDDEDTLKKSEFAWSEDDDSEKLDQLYFAFNKADVAEDQKDKIESSADKAKELLAEAKADGFNAKLVVAGYACKSPGSTDKHNQDISETRAKKVADKLIESGISEDDITYKGYGATNLVVEEGSREEQWQNRRVELDVVYS